MGFGDIRPGQAGLSDAGPVQAARTPGMRLCTASTGRSNYFDLKTRTAWSGIFVCSAG